MVPFAVLGIVMYGDTNYNPLSDLPARRSERGRRTRSWRSISRLAPSGR